MARNWTEEELEVALALYCKLPFGQFHSRNPLIMRVAGMIERTPDALAMKLSNLASLDPVITGTGRSGLRGASALDKQVWAAFTAETEHWMPRIEARLDDLLGDEGLVTQTDRVSDDPSLNYTADEVIASSRQRRGQGLFRNAVLTAYRNRCCVTGVSEPRLLVASHIRPWRLDHANRLNPRNGLCLNALVDRAFDQGLITLSADFCLMVSPELQSQRGNPHLEETFWSREGEVVALPDKFTPDATLLAWHREEWFSRARPDRATR